MYGTCFIIWRLDFNDFDAGKSITQAIGRGWALKSKPFWPSLVTISGSTSTNGPRNGYCPYQNHYQYVPRHTNNR